MYIMIYIAHLCFAFVLYHFIVNRCLFCAGIFVKLTPDSCLYARFSSMLAVLAGGIHQALCL
ncbi:hypothetical protein VR7878_03761 [Vibrio ruber DSM 16370]|uniref:Uncharacterized protein n=1 Tax=Vibrio ruber (strain DSM 16370 / JCM 11486 / BCRC 17186 / CECT 7878 / LMG 23124 / VR1) TaxID=1123498 RepID=A0A1R4LTD3_VIBR1|nr:hypothetical protein VR7878_03761 [Vibrio ruber DSM 16370]